MYQYDSEESLMVEKSRIGGIENLEEIEKWLIGKEQYLPKFASLIDWLLAKEYWLIDSKQFLDYWNRYFREEVVESLPKKERKAIEGLKWYAEVYGTPDLRLEAMFDPLWELMIPTRLTELV